jgi:phthalate 4,5-cis-dihydrodiol dehydrogenase
MQYPEGDRVTSVQEGARPINLAISGLGLAGAMMIRAAKIHPNVVLYAGADPLPRPRETFARDFGAKAHADFQALCDDPAVEAIYIASPHQFHAEQAIMGAAAGKHLIVEKPVALTLADCDAIHAAAERAGIHLIVGHTHAFDPNVGAIRRMVQSGELGRLGMILNFNYTDFLCRPRRPDELDTAKGGGITFNQVTHQIEIARQIGGGLVRSVRANVGSLDPLRPTEGTCQAFLEFENGAAATLVYSSHDFFDSDEFHDWVAEGGQPKIPARWGQTRQNIMLGAKPEEDLQKDLGYGGRFLPPEQPFLPHFGILIVTCERGDLRVTPEGLALYGLAGRKDVPVERGLGRPGHGDVLDALWGALRHGRRDFHDAQWGKATLEVALAILRSARERREVLLEHQVACP